MDPNTAHANLVVAWGLILAGFLGGLLLGSGFHREEWLGGYTSLRRRLYRLGHISFFGLAILNLLFYFTVRAVPLSGRAVGIASWAFIVGAVSMPLCCLVMAHRPRLQMLFAVPVVSLLLAGSLTLWEVLQ